MSINKPSNSKEELKSKKSKKTDELNDLEDVSMRDGDGISIYWGDEWNIEKGEKISNSHHTLDRLIIY